ncbi:putative DNA-binding protein [Lapidilactobacillus luobeiensis]|uniref:putative DNA-binding protein n=1 Tax=Lapidilactobacillus luobeiensis TaxID=2950371 RepID=UPI0021C3F975|nr:putative DNA-binding protein [Lapidilactobacillus luobeiensis]
MADEVVELNERINELFDFYRPLLTKKQATYLELYYAQDYSLGEIATQFSVSRQAVYDNLKRTAKILLGYEDKLHLIAHFQKEVALVDRLKQQVANDHPDDPQLQRLLQDFEKLVDSQ